MGHHSLSIHSLITAGGKGSGFSRSLLWSNRCLLRAADMLTTATVKAITNGVATVEPMKPAYAINAGSVQIGFAAADPDHPGSHSRDPLQPG